MKYPFYTNSEPVFLERFANFLTKAPGYTASIAVITPARIAKAQAFHDAATALVNAIASLRTYAQNLTALRNRLHFGPEGPPDVNWTAAPVVTPLTTALPADQIALLSDWLVQIKRDEGYTTAAGEDLGIEKPQEEEPDLNTVTPELSNPRGLPGGHAQFDWVKGMFDAVLVEGQRGAATTWEPLGRDQFSPFDDVRPLLVPGQSETRRYRVRYVLGDTPVGQWSAVIEITLPA